MQSVVYYGICLGMTQRGDIIGDLTLGLNFSTGTFVYPQFSRFEI